MRRLFSIWGMLLCCIVSAGNLKLTKQSDQIQIVSGGEIYSINTAPRGTWANGELLQLGNESPDRLTIALRAGDMSLQPLAQPKDFQIELDSPERIVVSGNYRLADVSNPKKIFEPLLMKARFEFIAGVPGCIVSGRVSALTPSEVQSLTIVAGKGYSSFSMNGGEVLKNPKDWAPLLKLKPEMKGQDYYVVATRADRRLFFYPPRNSTDQGGFYVPVVDSWKKRHLEPGDGWDFRVVIGLGGDEKNDRTMIELYKTAPALSDEQKKSEAAVEIPESTTELNVTYLASPPRCDGSFSGWDHVPVLARRGDDLGDSRPRYAPNYSGKQDLSFVLKGGFDDKNLYLLVTVLDDIHQQDNQEMTCWSGDSIQMAFDPLCEREFTPNYIELGLAVSPKGKKSFWCWYHPDKKRTGDLSKLCRWSVRRNTKEKSFEYELALPLEFLCPFALERGKLGFNLVAWDADGNGVEKWMGITDGLKKPQDYKNLLFHLDTMPDAASHSRPNLFFDGPLILSDRDTEFSASAIVSAQDLPAQLETTFSSGLKFVHPLQAGLNFFHLKIPANKLSAGQQNIIAVVTRQGKSGTPVSVSKEVSNADAVEQQIAEVEGLNERLKANIQKLKEKKVNPAYLNASAAIADYFIKQTRQDISAKQIYRRISVQTLRKMIPVSNKQRLFIFERAIKNFGYLKRMLNDKLIEADAALSGQKNLPSVPSMPHNMRSYTKNGGIYLGDQEYLFVGPNTWGLHYRDLDLFAAAGFNFFDIFQYQGDFVDSWEEPRQVPVDDADYRFNGRLITRAEELGLYFYSRQYSGNNILNPEHDELERERDHWSGVMRFQAQSPSSLYVVTLYERLPNVQQIPVELFRKYLLHKFESVTEINRIFHTDYQSIDDCQIEAASRNSALKYELFLFQTARNLKNVREANAIKRGIWGDRPFSTAYTLVNFQPWNPLEQCADYEKIWKEFDYIGWDGGVGEFGDSYATRWSVDEIMFCDLARSVSPEKPVTNQEVHIIPDGYHGDNDFDRIYLGMILPYLHGRNTGVLWYWTMDWYSRHGEFFSERADSFHAFSKAALDLRRLVNEISPYRAQESPVALLYSVPSLADSGYIQQMTNVYEGLFFTGFPVRFVTEDMVAAGALKNFKALVVPNSRRIPEKTFMGIADFINRGGYVLRFGSEALTCDEYGNLPATNRGTALAKCATSKSDMPKDILTDCCGMLDKLGLSPEIDLRSPAGQRIFALEYRNYTGNDGRKRFYAVNQSKHSIEFSMPAGNWEELIAGNPVGKTVVLPPAGICMFREK